MSDASSLASRRTRAAAESRTRTDSLRLGRVFRSIVLAPRAGYEAAFKIGYRRAKAGAPVVEGRAPLVFSVAGGAAAMLLTVKVGGLIAFREVSSAEFRWSYLLMAVLIGGLVGGVAQRLWGIAAPRVVEGLRGSTSPWQMRLVWGASAFPQIAALIVLLPLDLALVGSKSFTTDRLVQSYETVWAALSISLSIALVVWSMYLFVRGIETATGLSMSRSVLLAVLGVVTLVGLFALLVLAPVFL
jgi:hypothetical protein